KRFSSSTTEKSSRKEPLQPFLKTSASWRLTLAANRMLLQVRDIHAGYGKLDILHGITLDVGRGELVCIIGPNGSGKSTTLKSITGFLLPLSVHPLFNERNF